MGGSARRRGVGGADSSLQPSSAPLRQMAFTRNLFSGAPWGWGDNQLASGMRGAAVKDLPFLQRRRGSPGRRGSSLCSGAGLVPGGTHAAAQVEAKQGEITCLQNIHQEEGNRQRPGAPGSQVRLPPELPGGWPGRTLLCWFDFPALECFQCDRINTNGVCVSGGGTCQTQDGQQCFLRKIYEDGTLSYGRQGCSQLCTPMKLFNPNVIVEYKCCHDSPLCNKF